MKKKVIIWTIFSLFIVWILSILLWMIFSPNQPVSKYVAGIAASPVSLYCSLSGGDQSIHQQGNYLTLFNVPGDSCAFHEKGIIDPGFDLSSTLINQTPTMCSCGPDKCWNGYRCVTNP